MSRVKTVIEIDGTLWHAEIGTVDNVHLDYEDHGIFSAAVSFTFDGSAQSLGHYCLDEPFKDDDGKTHRRGSAYGMDFIIGLTRILGDLTKAKGQQCFVLRPYSHGGLISGIATLDGKRHLLPDELADLHFPERVTS